MSIVQTDLRAAWHRTRMWAVAPALLIGALSCRPVQYVDPSVPSPDATPSTPPSAPPRGAPDRPVRPGAPAPPSVLLDAPELPREFRGVWVATVANIDWPSRRTLSTADQQRELLALLDRAQALHLNAVIFQVRPAADALYASDIEPWSEYLTGAQGKAPNPYWDPLAFVVKAAHERNMELHAWFNPYRARHTDARSPLAPSHISRTHPSLVKPYAGYLWMDPGERTVRERTLQVVLDVVKRYDIDGVHIDDYFYPYPENTRRGAAIPFPDEASWKRYRSEGGTLSRSDWRRSNVDVLVQQLNDGIHRVKPWVRFGISPFGIWRPGYPAQVRGLDAYEALYADARKWLREGWLDYFTPQLYWPTTKVAQAYQPLLAWWSDENVMKRHLWPGNFTSRAAGPGSSAFSVSELMEQIRVTRLEPGATGNVHFSMKAFLVNQGSMNDSLMQGEYAGTALVPATPWLTADAPPIPVIELLPRTDVLAVRLGTTTQVPPWQWLMQVRYATGWANTVLSGSTRDVTIDNGDAVQQLTLRTINRLGIMSPSISVPLNAQARGRSTPSRRVRIPSAPPAEGVAHAR